MALTMKDILQLHSLQGFTLVAGQGGLSNFVVSAGILDYEYSHGVDFPGAEAFDKSSFVISSLLFAKYDPDLLMPAIKGLYLYGVSGFAFKSVIFDNLPKEVLDFADQHNFPIFKFENDVFFENIIFEIMDAVQSEDSLALAEKNIRLMLNKELTRDEVFSVAKTISLNFKKFALAAYLKNRSDCEPLQTERIFKNFYLNKSLREKAFLCRYDRGIFVIITTAHQNIEPYQLILQELLQYFSISPKDIFVSFSNIHPPYEEMDVCIQESYCAYKATLVDGRSISHYSDIGSFSFLIPHINSSYLQNYSQQYLAPILAKDELFRTAVLYIRHKGDLALIASDLICHINTIRYRIGRLKELLEPANSSDYEFYEHLSIAIKIYLLQQQL